MIAPSIFTFRAAMLAAGIALLAGCGGGGSPSGGNPSSGDNPPSGSNPPGGNGPSDNDPPPIDGIAPVDIGFTSLDNVAPRLDYGSERVVIELDAVESVDVAVEGTSCLLAINDEAVDGNAGVVRSGDSLQVIVTASHLADTTHECVLDAGHGPVAFSVTTGPLTGNVDIVPGAIRLSWPAYYAVKSYQIRGSLAGQPETGVVLVDDIPPDVTSREFAINSFDIDWNNDLVNVWACSTLWKTGAPGDPCQALDNVRRVFTPQDSIAATVYVKAANTHRELAFGNAVAMNAAGDMIAVGAPYENGAATGIDGNDEIDCDAPVNCAENAGAVYIFRKGDDEWRQEAYIKASNTDAQDEFGLSVALSADGNVLAVGARDESSAATGIGGDQADNSHDEAGAVYLFRHHDGEWTQEAYVKASNTGAEDGFGAALALNAAGDVLAIGAPFEDSNATGVHESGFAAGADNSQSNAGAVYLFRHDGEQWAQEAYVKSPESESGNFGASIALDDDGDVLAAGADFAGNDQAGGAQVYHHAETGWFHAAQFTAPESAPEFGFYGTALALDGSGERLAIGMPDNPESPDVPGSVFVYQATAGTWNTVPIVELQASNSHEGMHFGSALAFTGDGTRLAVGATGEGGASAGIGGDQHVTDDCIARNDTCLSAASGAVYLFADTPGGWEQTHYLKAVKNGLGSAFGASANWNAAGDRLVVGGFDHSAARGIGGDFVDDCLADEPVNCAVFGGAVYIYE